MDKAIVFAVLAWLFYIFNIIFFIAKDQPQCLFSKDPILCVEIVKNKEK